MLLAFSFALLVQTGLIQVWHIFLLSFLIGSIAAFELPVQLAFLGDVTETKHISAAVSLNNLIRQASRTVGPAARWQKDKLRPLGIKRATRLIEAAENSVGVREGLRAAETNLKMLLAEYDMKKRQLEEIMVLV